MTIARRAARPLGTMVAYGFAGRALDDDLTIARRLGATVLEIFPDWRSWPDPEPLRARVADAGFSIQSAHGCWGGQSIVAPRVDLGETDRAVHAASVDDLKRCVDWLASAGGVCLVVHPGGLSAPEHFDARRDALIRGLRSLADHARGTGVIVCVENMPPGVFPGSRMADLAAIVTEIERVEVALALDTGHAQIAATAPAETRDAGRLLRATHVHDNDGRHDVHHPPGLGAVDWDAWAVALDAIDYRGPIMLECIRHFRKFPESLSADLLDLLSRLV